MRLVIATMLEQDRLHGLRLREKGTNGIRAGARTIREDGASRDIMDDNDLFGAIESVRSDSISSVPVAHPVDKMSSVQYYSKICSTVLDAARQEEARRQATSLLNSMFQGDCGDSVEPAVKRYFICVYVALPPDMPFELLVTRDVVAAKSYTFSLDAFQREAITCIENNQSVLVSAHTFAGKTVVALYAIAQSLRSKQSVIYTSPVKALSNQKFRELEEEFGDVVLMTD
ncbi:unnamed protein product [Angiostrongylus costaricensis]|uniref:Helicase ATP-binding domain-containing protein n=1 Tax=Angiostrongylus costaricensis TaxID=334426 RepID=A0A0R3PU75_ANGCS|nr:unnamed protein product [Angiostrongylus costaricensis]